MQTKHSCSTFAFGSNVEHFDDCEYEDSNQLALEVEHYLPKYTKAHRLLFRIIALLVQNGKMHDVETGTFLSAIPWLSLQI